MESDRGSTEEVKQQGMELRGYRGAADAPPQELAPTCVVVTDVRMRFVSMIVFMVKWAVASLPALAILIVFGLVIGTIAARTLTLAANWLTVDSDAGLTLIVLVAVTSLIILGTQAARADRRGRKARQAAETAYLPNVVVRNVRVDASEPNDPAVFGTVENLGNQTLNAVEITVCCLDLNRNIVHQETWTVGLENAGELFEPGKSRDFDLRLEGLKTEWKELDVKVTGVEIL
jgi:hypothetical protein